MIPIEIIPYERDKKAKQMYQFFHWFIRKHRKAIKNNAQEVLRQIVLFGDIDWNGFDFSLK